jgi:hypothetical protein
MAVVTELQCGMNNKNFDGVRHVLTELIDEKENAFIMEEEDIPAEEDVPGEGQTVMLPVPVAVEGQEDAPTGGFAAISFYNDVPSEGERMDYEETNEGRASDTDIDDGCTTPSVGKTDPNERKAHAPTPFAGKTDPNERKTWKRTARAPTPSDGKTDPNGKTDQNERKARARPQSDFNPDLTDERADGRGRQLSFVDMAAADSKVVDCTTVVLASDDEEEVYNSSSDKNVSDSVEE